MMITNIARFVQNKFWVMGLTVLLPLTLAGCGSTSGDASLDSASLALPPTSLQAPEGDTTATPEVTVQDNLSTLTKAKPAMTAQAKKISGAKKSENSIKTVLAKAEVSSEPARRIYRKERVKLSPTHTASISKPVSKLDNTHLMRTSAKPTVRKPQKKKVVAKVKSAVKKAKKVAVKKVSAPVPAKKMEAPMVPMQVIPVQIMPARAPQDIMDAFNETPADPEPETEKLAKAETTPVMGGFGQADHRFSGQ
jgi:hypothetical protein